jgi:hypothetical protein
MIDLRPRSERGQALILFVGIFTVVLVVAAFAIDQGLWLNHRRIAQKDADAAARAGAARYLSYLDNPDFGAASDAALAIAADNGAPGLPAGATPPTWSPKCDSQTDTTCARSKCPLESGAPLDAAPSIEIAVPRPAPSLFLRLFGAGNADNIGARSTACVGGVTRLQIGEGGPSSALPIVLNQRDPDASDSCFLGSGLLRYTQDCVIFGATAPYEAEEEDLPPPPPSHPQLVADTSSPCFTGPTSFDCSIAPRASSVDVVDVSDYPTHAYSANLRRQIFNEVGSCTSAFGDVFAYANGEGNSASGPPAAGGSDPIPDPNDPDNGIIYLQKKSDPCLAVLPIVSFNPHQVPGTRRLTGFAVVWIKGCVDVGSGPPSPWHSNPCSAGGSETQEIWGVPLHVFMITEAIGRIETTDVNAPLTIQTVK